MYIVPGRLGNFLPVDRYFSTFIFGSETDHQGVREGPGLASKVFYVLDCYANFFQDLSFQTLLKGLARFNESGNDGMYISSRSRVVRQKDIMIFYNGNNHGRR